MPDAEERLLRIRRAGAPARHQAAALPRHPRRGRRVPQPRRLRRPRRPRRPARGHRSCARPRAPTYTVLRPTLEDFVVEMPRGAQVIYPKDLAPICMLADIGPGHAGVRERRRLGRAVDDDAALGRRDRRLRAPRGLRQPGPHQRPRASSARTCSSATTSSCATATRASTATDRSTGSCSTCPSRGRSCRTPRGVCAPGGILVAYTPSITQAAQAARRRCRGAWIDARTLEVLHRGWHIEGQAVRPDHRMVAHTGFLTVARFLGRPPDVTSATPPPIDGVLDAARPCNLVAAENPLATDSMSTALDEGLARPRMLCDRPSALLRGDRPSACCGSIVDALLDVGEAVVEQREARPGRSLRRARRRCTRSCRSRPSCRDRVSLGGVRRATCDFTRRVRGTRS